MCIYMYKEVLSVERISTEIWEVLSVGSKILENN
jgi:hypothetical protein